MHPFTKYRKSEKISKAKLAKRLGVSRASITRYESGEREVAIDLVPKFSEITKIPAEELRPDLAGLFRKQEPAECT